MIFSCHLTIEWVNNHTKINDRTFIRRNYRIFLGLAASSKWRAKIMISKGQTAATACMFNEYTAKISRVNQNTSRLLLTAMASSSHVSYISPISKHCWQPFSFFSYFVRVIPYADVP